MLKLAASYRTTWPWPLRLSVLLIVILSTPPLLLYLLAVFGKTEEQLATLGPLGDFFGGHVAAISSSLTLIIVLTTSYIQQTSDRTFRLREQFLAGLAVIGQYDIARSGCEQALRLLDHYAGLALALEDDELLLLLNTVMTRDIRLRLEEIEKEKGSEIYVYARKAKGQISEILREHHMERKGIKKKAPAKPSQETSSPEHRKTQRNQPK
ncbi:hypothetical protein [Roseateles sp.]|uniref:hypothetical protein n=1 Tax=Roseateles sp. TaxID=1971397 RepID=UPI0031D93AF2